MTFWWKLGLIAAAAAAAFNAGYFVKDKIDEAAQADLLRQQIKAQTLRQDEVRARAVALEAELAALRESTAALNRKWNTLRAQDPLHCPLGSGRVGLLRDATATPGDAPR